MLAPNMTLELALRDPVQTSSNSQRPEQRGAEPSSFERALERARTEKNSTGTEKVEESEQIEEPQEQASAKEVKDIAHEDEAASTQEVDSGNSQKQELAKEDVPKKNLGLALVVEEDALVPDAQMPKELGVVEERNPELLSKDSVLKELVSDKTSEKKDTLLVEVPEEGALVSAESLVQAAEMQEASLEKSEKKTKKLSAEDVDYSIARILQGTQQGEGATSPLAVAEAQGEAKVLKLETGTSLDEKIQVQDLRTAAENGVTEASIKDGNFVATVNSGEGSADITMQLTNGGEVGAKVSASPSGGKESGFGPLLANQLQNNATEIVRTGSIILRDGNMGTINLILHPEELGNVKISLELNDRMVSAQIRVASEEAYMALKDSISSIKQAFADSGFDTGSFDLSWSGNGQQQQNGQQGQNQSFVAFANTLYGEMMAEDSLESGAEGENLQKKYSDSSQTAVNIMA